MADHHAYEAFEGNNPHPSLGNEAVASQSAISSQANLQPNDNMPNHGNVNGAQPQGDFHIHPDIPPLTEEVRAAIVALANSNIPVEVQSVDVVVLEAIIRGVARFLHAENGQCRHLDEVTGEQCPPRKWKAGGRKCMRHHCW